MGQKPWKNISYVTQKCLRAGHRASGPDFGRILPDLGLKLKQNKPNISGGVPSNPPTTTPTDYWPISASFDDDRKLLNCEIAQPDVLTSEAEEDPSESSCSSRDLIFARSCAIAVSAK